MKTGLLHLLRSSGFAVCVHVGLWILLYLSVSGLRGKTPDYQDSQAFSSPPQSPVPVARLEPLFSPGEWPKAPPDTNRVSSFYTPYFIPRQTPAPPPPTTRKIELTYQGFYQTTDGPRQAMVKMGESFLVTPIGSRVVSNLFAADVTIQALTLTNLAAQTNLLPLNIKKELEVPLQ